VSKKKQKKLFRENGEYLFELSKAIANKGDFECTSGLFFALALPLLKGGNRRPQA
jgi:hypothetical protein